MENEVYKEDQVIYHDANQNDHDVLASVWAPNEVVRVNQLRLIIHKEN